MRTRMLAPVAACVALVGSLLVAAPATADTWSVPARGTLVLDGRGYGHGKGLSQYGAQGAARDGKGWRAIVEHYYPGTAWGRASGTLRVLIAADTGRDLVVGARPGLVARRPGTDALYDLAGARPAAVKWRVLPVDGGRRSELSSRTRNGSWQRWKVVGGELEVFAAGKPVRLFTPAGATSYRGTLRSARSTGSDRDTVNVVPLEAYLRGVVPLEVPALWHPNAVRAQSVAARTYAVHERENVSAQRHYDLCDTTSCQVYGGVTAEHEASDAAVAATRQQVLLHEGRAAFTQFSASNGGWSVAGSQPYLRARKDPWDVWSGNPHRSWTVEVSDRTVESQWPAIGELRSVELTDRDGNGQWGGRVGRVVLRGSAGTVTVSGEDFRYLLGLRSTWFTVASVRRG